MYVQECVLYKSPRCPQSRNRRITGFFFLAAIPFTGQPHPSSYEKCFITISHESLSCVCADATQAQRTSDSRFHPVPRSESSLLSRRERVEGAEVQRGEGRPAFFHTRSGLLSVFTLRLGNSFRFSRISCKEREVGKWHS